MLLSRSFSSREVEISNIFPMFVKYYVRGIWECKIPTLCLTRMTPPLVTRIRLASLLVAGTVFTLAYSLSLRRNVIFSTLSCTTWTLFEQAWDWYHI
ncbi:hypothetical protein B0T14DRAFT_508159 [Immersiella caudata]|uniref:Uncharacterized protein n=1 Tax=Immersiella caudata TaxID=314043 RepID=A0AA39XHA6_9PEZI|nr:hypothetical protein B0T14DRAFT_508159 [Immersiella caudata]